MSALYFPFYELVKFVESVKESAVEKLDLGAEIKFPVKKFRVSELQVDHFDRNFEVIDFNRLRLFVALLRRKLGGEFFDFYSLRNA